MLVEHGAKAREQSCPARSVLQSRLPKRQTGLLCSRDFPPNENAPAQPDATVHPRPQALGQPTCDSKPTRPAPRSAFFPRAQAKAQPAQIRHPASEGHEPTYETPSPRAWQPLRDHASLPDPQSNARLCRTLLQIHSKKQARSKTKVQDQPSPGQPVLSQCPFPKMNANDFGTPPAPENWTQTTHPILAVRSLKAVHTSEAACPQR